MDIQKELKKWAEETVKVYNPIAETTQKGYYTQSVLSRIKNENQLPDILILGINPGAEGGSIYQNGDELLQGNPCFKGKSDKEIMYDLFDRYDPRKRKKGWDLMVKVRKMLELAGKQTLKDIDKFVLSNMVFLGTAKQGEIPLNNEQQIECAEQTLKLIDILNPKIVLLLGEQCRYLFGKVAKGAEMDELIQDKHVFYSFYKNRHVIAIYHTAYYAFYNDDDNKKVIGNILGYALDNPSDCIDKKQFESYISKSLKVKPTTERKVKTGENRFKLFKENIKSNGADSCSLLYGGKLLNYEFYTKMDSEGKHLKTLDRIAVELLIDGNDYMIRVGTRRNDQKIIRKMANAFDDRFTPGDTELTGPHWHVHAKYAQNTPDDEIIEEMSDLLMWVNAYRDGIISTK